MLGSQSAAMEGPRGVRAACCARACGCTDGQRVRATSIGTEVTDVCCEGF